MAKHHLYCHKTSRLFQPLNVVPYGATIKHPNKMPKSHKLMLDQGIIAPSQNGFFYLLPLAVKALDKLSRLVDSYVTDIGAQKIACPSLTSSDIWDKTGRLSAAGADLFHVQDRHHNKFILSPTHEESVTQLLASLPPLSHKQLPLLLYQTTSKFRDEIKPRFGLLRTKEFLMSDLYSFDVSLEAAKLSYENVSHVYNKIFKAIGVNFIKVKGVAGMMGGEESHEYHYAASVGEDTLLLCGGCGHGWNREANPEGPCENCGQNNTTETKGIEVGHTFLLGTRYSAPLQASCSRDRERLPLVMGSYGLGLSRVLAATLEVLSLPDQLRWPSALVPYSIVIITPKEGSKEMDRIRHLPEELYWSLQEVSELQNNVIIDDRAQMTIGRRLNDARTTGYPLVAVVGKAAASPHPMIELHHTHSGKMTLHSPADLVTAVANNNHTGELSVEQ